MVIDDIKLIFDIIFLYLTYNLIGDIHGKDG